MPIEEPPRQADGPKHVSQPRESYRPEGGLGARWKWMFVFLTASLSSTILLKVGQIQYLEILYAVQIVVLLFAFVKNDWQVRVSRSILRLGALYLAFLAIVLGLALWALRRDFYMLAGLTTLKYPVIVTCVRGAELLASVSAMLYLSHLFRKDDRTLRFAMRVYFRVGVASAMYAVATYPLARSNIAYLGASIDHRMRGFYNEGGPYGLYVISALLVGMSLHELRWEERRWLQWGFPLLSIAFLGSQSKAAVVAFLLIGVVDMLLLRSAAQRAVFAAIVLAAVFVSLQVVDVTAGVRIYREAGVAYERASHQHKNDINFVLGRVAGAFIVPRMISEHPLAGVGWGNYELVRNAPEYRGASAWVDIADEPGLGLFSLAAELGLPLLSLLVFCLLLPAIYLRRGRAAFPLMNLALMQPVAHLFGAQLNLTYPWIVSAFALGLGLRPSQGMVPAKVKAIQTDPDDGRGA